MSINLKKKSNEEESLNVGSVDGNTESYNSAEDLNSMLNDADEQNARNDKKMNQTNSSGETDVKKFLNIFSEDNQEEVVMSESAIKNIEEDIVLEKTKKKTSIKPIIIGILFIIFLVISIAISYILSTFNVVLGYNVYYAKMTNNDGIVFSLVEKGVYCNPQLLKVGDCILYTEGEKDKTFNEYRVMKITEIRKNTIHGYCPDSGEYKDINSEKICYQLNGDIQLPGEGESSTNN